MAGTPAAYMSTQSIPLLSLTGNIEWQVAFSVLVLESSSFEDQSEP